MNKQPLALAMMGSALFSPLSMADFVKDSHATLGVRNFYWARLGATGFATSFGA